MGVTFRSVVIGLMLIPLNTLWVVLAELGWYSGFPTCLSLFFNAVFCVFVIVAGNLVVERFWVCVMIGWFLKVAVLRYSGVKAYRPAIPFFIGLILGDFIVGALWNVYGIIMEVKVYRFWF